MEKIYPKGAPIRIPEVPLPKGIYIYHENETYFVYRNKENELAVECVFSTSVNSCTGDPVPPELKRVLLCRAAEIKLDLLSPLDNLRAAMANQEWSIP